MMSAFGVEHGEISKMAPGEYGFSSKGARKRTMKEISRDSRMSRGHGNKQRVAAATGVGTGLGAATGAVSGLGLPGRYKAIGAGVGAGIGAATGALAGKAENMERSAARNVGGAMKRGDVRRVKPGERTTSFRNIITKD
jgi:hypothetical protein